jgi:hypothetical protein
MYTRIVQAHGGFQPQGVRSEREKEFTPPDFNLTVD